MLSLLLWVPEVVVVALEVIRSRYAWLRMYLVETFGGGKLLERCFSE